MFIRLSIIGGLIYVQTFLPEASYEASAAALDTKRLGKQRVEALQIEHVLIGLSTGWANHPAVRMWEGYLPALRMYKRACILEWVKRGFVNNMEIPSIQFAPRPWWYKDPLIDIHQGVLIYKNPSHYQPMWPKQLSGAMNIWPNNQSITYRYTPFTR